MELTFWPLKRLCYAVQRLTHISFVRLQKTGKAAVITHAVDLKKTEVKLQVLQFICIIKC